MGGDAGESSVVGIVLPALGRSLAVEETVVWNVADRGCLGIINSSAPGGLDEAEDHATGVRSAELAESGPKDAAVVRAVGVQTTSESAAEDRRGVEEARARSSARRRPHQLSTLVRRHPPWKQTRVATLEVDDGSAPDSALCTAARAGAAGGCNCSAGAAFLLLRCISDPTPASAPMAFSVSRPSARSCAALLSAASLIASLRRSSRRRASSAASFSSSSNRILLHMASSMVRSTSLQLGPKIRR